MKRTILFILIFQCILCHSQSIKSPSEFLGYELGSRFTWHHQVVDYFEYLESAASGRMQLTQYGTTYEGRPLILAYLSTPDAMHNLDAIRREHLKSTTGESKSTKAIVWLSYNVHGNESVSTEASMQTAYELLTRRTEYLENTIVIIDPCINPDGRDRYVNWYKQYRNEMLQADPNSKEHHEGWWTGRSNHYMFDLNRDWAWLTQVESRQRLKKYNEWLPHIHVDFHEQGIDEPYYFAPAAEPFHEVITDFQRNFQVTLGRNHARYFDANGWLYFTKEIFDLFYPSYGDTYPTYNGAVGMTYEQGGSGSAGLGVLTSIGDTLTLRERISHHLTTGLSTVEVASANAELLNDSFRKFYRNHNFRNQSYVLNGNRDRLDALSKLLDAHEITYGAGTGTVVKGFDYKQMSMTTARAGEGSLVVSTDQTRGTLVKVLFEPNAKLNDSLTYDITAWSLPYAYGLDAIATDKAVPTGLYSRKQVESAVPDPEAYAYLTDWNSMQDARFLSYLLQHGIRVRNARRQFTLEGINHAPGSLIITRADNKGNPYFLRILADASVKYDKDITSARTGLVDDGRDLGSEAVQAILPPRVAVLGGEPTNSLDFGEVWHFFEQQLEYPISVIHSNYLREINLSEYDILIFPGGSGYTDFYDEELLSDLKEWVANGGRLIAIDGALKGLGGESGFSIRERIVHADSSGYSLYPHEDMDRIAIKDEITGAIFKTRVDPTHPLAFGYGDTYYSLKMQEDRYEYLDKGTVVYTEDEIVPVAGFAGSQARKNREHTLVFGVEDSGAGHVIYLVDNPLFRGFWENGKLFFANALFMMH